MELPGVVERQVGPDGVRIELDVHPGLQCFEGHFPGHPVLPGVVQIAWGVHFSRECFSYGPAIRALEHIKFKKPIHPGSQVYLLLKRDRRDGSVDFEYYDADVSYASGTLRFMDST